LNSGRELAKARGTKMGRPKGSSLPKEAFLAKYSEVVRHLKRGKNSIREIAKLARTSVSTVQRVKTILEKKESPKIKN
jgi:DNA invertase Pin-like site-specific DNA recombinase